jgi:hypothetical protein
VVAHTTLLAAGLVACVLHCLIRTLRWYRVSDVCAIGVYSVVFPHLPDPRDPGCVEMVHDVARMYERELRWHTGSVARLFPALHFRLQCVTMLVAFPLIWFSRADPWFMLVPAGACVAGWAYFHARGWRWLQAGCDRYRMRNQI